MGLGFLGVRYAKWEIPIKSKLNYYYNTCEIDGRLVHRMIDYLESELEKKAEVFPIPEDFQRAALVEYFETGKRGLKIKI